MRPKALVLVLVLATACGAFQTAAAVVNGKAIEEDRFRRIHSFIASDPRFAAQLPEDEGDEERRNLGRQLLTFLIHQEIIEAYADARGLQVPEQAVEARLAQQVREQGGEESFQAQLDEAGATMEDVRFLVEKQMIREAVAQQLVSEEIPETQLRQEFEQRLAELTQVHVAHILVNEQEEAENLRGRATPANFASLARRFSTDPGSAEEGGDLGTRPAAEYVEPFDRAILEIPVGEIGGPVQTEFGFHVIHVIERTEPTFEEARETLLAEFGQEFFTNWLLERVRAAEVLVNPRYGHLDPETGQVVERRTTAATPDAVQIEP